MRIQPAVNKTAPTGRFHLGKRARQCSLKCVYNMLGEKCYEEDEEIGSNGAGAGVRGGEGGRGGCVF